MQAPAKNPHREIGIQAASDFFKASISQQMRESVKPIFQGVTDDHVAFDIYEGYAAALLTLLIGDLTTALGPSAMEAVLRRAQLAGIIGGTIGHLELRESVAETDAEKAIKTAMSKG